MGSAMRLFTLAFLLGLSACGPAVSSNDDEPAARASASAVCWDNGSCARPQNTKIGCDTCTVHPDNFHGGCDTCTIHPDNFRGPCDTCTVHPDNFKGGCDTCTVQTESGQGSCESCADAPRPPGLRLE